MIEIRKDRHGAGQELCRVYTRHIHIFRWVVWL